MKYLTFFILVIIFAGCVNSKTGSGNIISNTRNVAAFNAISASGSVNVTVQNGPQSVVVETDDNIMRNVETTVSGNTLKIRLKNSNNLRNSTVNVYVTAPVLKDIDASASAEIESKGSITSDSEIELKASSGSKIQIDLDAPSVKADASSGGSVLVSGRTRNLTAKSSSGSNVNALSLKAENAIADASSGASIKVSASISVKAEASSGATVKYTGGATEVKKSESSGGSVSGN